MSQFATPTNAERRPMSNSLGFAGFLCSTIGLVCTVGILCPIGFVLSLIGLRKQPRGFAIAGSIIGSSDQLVCCSWASRACWHLRLSPELLDTGFPMCTPWLMAHRCITRSNFTNSRRERCQPRLLICKSIPLQPLMAGDGHSGINSIRMVHSQSFQMDPMESRERLTTCRPQVRARSFHNHSSGQFRRERFNQLSDPLLESIHKYSESAAANLPPAFHLMHWRLRPTVRLQLREPVRLRGRHRRATIACVQRIVRRVRQ